MWNPDKKNNNALTVMQAIRYFVLFRSNIPLAKEYCAQTFSREKGNEEGEGKAKFKFLLLCLRCLGL